jgi:hypothetical protein
MPVILRPMIQDSIPQRAHADDENGISDYWLAGTREVAKHIVK